MPQLTNGDAFPAFAIARVGGGEILLPRDLTGGLGVVLIYRGAWCPFCVAQLADFAGEAETLTQLGVKVVALSIDDEATTEALAAKVGFPFPIGHSADADAVRAVTGAFVNDTPHYLQPTGFVLNSEGNVMAAMYSTSAIGRLGAADVVKLARFVAARAAKAANI